MLNYFFKSKVRSFFTPKLKTFSKNDWDQENIDMIAIYEKSLNKQPRRTGGGWIGVCPFPDHQDRTPSFVMYPDTNSYFCFGCNKSGKASWFKREMERIYGNNPIPKGDK